RRDQVFHTYDYRYQDGYSRQRVAAMYLPLIHHMAAKALKLDAMNPRDPERREMLATLLYVLQDAPEALLREMWKDVGVRFFRVFGRIANAGGSRSGGGGIAIGLGTPSPGTRRGSACFSSGAFSSESFSTTSPYAGGTPGNRTVYSPFSSHVGGASRFGPGGGGGIGGSVGVGVGVGGSSSAREGSLGLRMGRAAAADRTLAAAHALAPLPQEVRGAGVGYLIIDEYQV
ncbi:unnamed protein product, partial [Laminaria digitata]